MAFRSKTLVIHLEPCGHKSAEQTLTGSMMCCRNPKSAQCGQATGCMEASYICPPHSFCGIPSVCVAFASHSPIAIEDASKEELEALRDQLVLAQKDVEAQIPHAVPSDPADLHKRIADLEKEVAALRAKLP